MQLVSASEKRRGSGGGIATANQIAELTLGAGPRKHVFPAIKERRSGQRRISSNGVQKSVSAVFCLFVCLFVAPPPMNPRARCEGMLSSESGPNLAKKNSSVEEELR